MRIQKHQPVLTIVGLTYANRKRLKFSRFGRSLKKVGENIGMRTGLYNFTRRLLCQLHRNPERKFLRSIILTERLTWPNLRNFTSKWLWPPVWKKFSW